MKDVELLENIKERIRKNPYYYQIKDKTDRDTIINDLFMNVWEKIRSGEMSDEWEEIKGYVFISGRNNCLNFLRKHKNQIKMSIDSDISDSNNFKYDEDTDRVEFIEEENKKIKFLKEIDLLGTMDRKILDMRVEGMMMRDIAEELNEPLEEIERINRNMVRYLRNQWWFTNTMNRRYDSKDIMYRVYDTKTNTSMVFETQIDICREYLYNRNKMKHYINTGKMFRRRYIIKTILKNKNK